LSCIGDLYGILYSHSDGSRFNSTIDVCHDLCLCCIAIIKHTEGFLVIEQSTLQFFHVSASHIDF
jgi:hypothetical protein